jgi:hypothetical protein
MQESTDQIRACTERVVFVVKPQRLCPINKRMRHSQFSSNQIVCWSLVLNTPADKEERKNKTTATVMEDFPQVISNHPEYPGCKLYRVTGTQTFTCDGCLRSGGAGTRYRLEQYGGKSYDYHICCAVAPSTQFSLKHPTFGDLEFKPEPQDRTDGKGRFNLVVYHCSGQGVSYHPCCAIETCKCSVATKEKTRRIPKARQRSPSLPIRQGCSLALIVNPCVFVVSTCLSLC